MVDLETRLTIATATRTYPGEHLNGDAWRTDWCDGACRIAVIDGLGHGPKAAAASDAALERLKQQPHLSPIDAINECHDALRETRGAAMAVARVTLRASAITFSGVGNVEAQLWDGVTVQRPIAFRGIVGRILPTVRDQVIVPDGPDWMLLLYTDGIRDRFNLEALPPFMDRDPQSLADMILRDWSRDTDDATVVVIAPNHRA